jgi:hypothetical protein
MLSYIFGNWFFNPTEDEIIVTPKTKQNRYKVLKEVNQFDKSILLPVPQSIQEFTQERKPSKIFTFKKKRVRKRKRKKSSN